MIQMAWLWTRHQPASAWSRWFFERVARNGGRMRKATIVALARKFLVAFWRYVVSGVVIEVPSCRPRDNPQQHPQGLISPDGSRWTDRFQPWPSTSRR